MKKKIFQLFLLFLLFGCMPNKKLSQEEVINPKKTYQEIAVKRFGNKVEYKFNSIKNYILCEKIISKPMINPNQLKEFFVFDVQKKEIIYSDKIANVKISWYNNTQLLITNQKGIITSPKDDGKWTYVYDLIEKKKITHRKK